MSAVEEILVPVSEDYEPTAGDEETNVAKRKREEEAAEMNGDSEEFAKKAKADALTAPVAAVSAHVVAVADLLPGQSVRIIEIAQAKVGQIIGSKGAIIQDIQTRSGARAFINQEFPDGVPRQVNITGTEEQIKAAEDLINLIITEGPTAIHANSLMGGPQITSMVECTQQQVGKVIGTGGAVIKEIQSKSGARIQIDQNFPDGVPRKVNITGTQQAVMLAVQLVNAAMTSTGPSAAAVSQFGSLYPMGSATMGQMQMGSSGEAKQVMDVPKATVGKIIGKGGENIQMIQRKSAARVTIDQTVEPCKVMLVGSPGSIQAAATMVQEIISGVPMDRIGMSLGGQGGGGMGGYGQMGGMGGYGQQMGGQMGGYGQGMGGMGGGMGGQGPYGQQGQGGGYGQQMQQQQSPAFGGGGYSAYGQSAPQQGQGGGYGQQQQPQQQQYGQQQQQQQQQQPAYGGMPQMGGQGQYGAPAPARPMPAAPKSSWTEHKTDEGITYFYNKDSGVSQWDKPAGM